MTTAKESFFKHKFLYNLILLSILFFAHCFWGDMMYIVFPILALMILLDNMENGISYIIFSIPFCLLNLYISSLLFLCCILVFIIKFYIIKFFKDRTKPNFLILTTILIFFVYCLLPIGKYNLNTLLKITILISLFIALCMLIYKPTIFRFKFNVRLFCLSIILSSIFSLTYYFSPYLQNYLFFIYADESIPRFMALFTHPNVLAMICEILLSVLAYFMMSKQSNKIDIVIFITLVGIGILTFSKTFLLVSGFIVLILLIWRFCCDFKRTIIFSLIIAIIVTVICLLCPQLVQTFVERFAGTYGNCTTFADFMNMITTDRYDLWIEYTNFLGQNPLVILFGRGLGAPVLSTLSPHNAYIAIIYELGIVGTCLFALAIIVIIKEFVKTNKLHWAIFVPLLVICSILLVEDTIFYIFL